MPSTRLRRASAKAAEGLQASCPAQMPTTPLARLDAVGTRLKADADGNAHGSPKLQQFYASLATSRRRGSTRWGHRRPPLAQQ